MTTVVPVILCGGSGSRLWPPSHSGFPGQFLVFSRSASLFQQAISRISEVLALGNWNFGRAIVLRIEEHRFLTLDQLSDL